jgi:RecB family exonuclease
VRNIRGTEVSDFLRCRTKWDYAWNEKLRAKTPNDKLFFGTLFHKFLEVLYNTNFNYDDAHWAMNEMFNETDTSGMEQVALDELWDLVHDVTINYYNQYKNTDSKFQVLATELHFAIPLSDKVTYTGTIDLVVKDEHGQVWFYDHKTTASIDLYEKRADMDRQISRYWFALQKLGYDVAGFVYNIILKDVPKKPELLKSGKLSQNKAQKTTYDLYAQAIVENGLDPSDYKEILEHLKGQENRYFRRMKVTRLQPEINASIDELITVAEDMENARIYRNITKDCHWDCAYQSICQASLDGSNADYLTKQLFIKEDNE